MSRFRLFVCFSSAELASRQARASPHVFVFDLRSHSVGSYRGERPIVTVDSVQYTPKTENVPIVTLYTYTYRHVGTQCTVYSVHQKQKTYSSSHCILTLIAMWVQSVIVQCTPKTENVLIVTLYTYTYRHVGTQCRVYTKNRKRTQRHTVHLHLSPCGYRVYSVHKKQKTYPRNEILLYQPSAQCFHAKLQHKIAGGSSKYGEGGKSPPPLLPLPTLNKYICVYIYNMDHPPTKEKIHLNISYLAICSTGVQGFLSTGGGARQSLRRGHGVSPQAVKIKLLMLGDSGVGKSSLMDRFTEDRFNISTVRAC